jgi:hypothetical protein
VVTFDASPEETGERDKHHYGQTMGATADAVVGVHK